MKRLQPERVETLLLARLAVRAGKPPTPAVVARALYAFAARELRQSEWQQTFGDALLRARQQGWIEPERLVLTAQGRARLQAALQLRTPPTADSWAQFQKRYLPRLFLHVVDAHADSSPGCAAAVLAERLGVECGLKSTPRQVLDLWLARRLGVDALSLEQLRNTLLARELGLPRRKTSAETLRVGIAHLAGAPSAQAGAVMTALAARWLSGSGPGSAAVPAGPPAAEPAPLDDAALGQFAQRVQAAAGSSRARRYGENKVFIGSVWQALSSDAEIGKLGEAGFKRCLIEAHRRGALVLGRADLVAAMDASEVHASEIKHQNATYHFIHRGQPA